MELNSQTHNLQEFSSFELPELVQFLFLQKLLQRLVIQDVLEKMCVPDRVEEFFTNRRPRQVEF